MLGAWGGHAAATAVAPEGTDPRTLRVRQLPLAAVMVVLTTLTLWSLGQDLVVSPEEEAGGASVAPALVTLVEAPLPWEHSRS
jgi:hypothetical protein